MLCLNNNEKDVIKNGWNFQRYCTFVPHVGLGLGLRLRLILSRVSLWWIINQKGGYEIAMALFWVQGIRIQAFRVQASRVQASRIQASGDQASSRPESKRQKSKRPVVQSRSVQSMRPGSSFSGIPLITLKKGYFW